MSFSFSFASDDIDVDAAAAPTVPPPPAAAAAFPIQGKPQLPAQHHALSTLLATLPSKLAFDTLPVALDHAAAAAPVHLPRRELWDVRVQIMAEDDGGDSAGVEGLGAHDVRTGVYEGGFKSWESSVDLVKVLAGAPAPAGTVVELGCGTALPSLALLQRALARLDADGDAPPLTLVLADYNPSVLRLVTLPNVLLAWALHRRAAGGAAAPAWLHEAFALGDELELSPALLAQFEADLRAARIRLEFLSGGWGARFVEVLAETLAQDAEPPAELLVLGAETIYSPFALQAFGETIFAILEDAQRKGVQKASVLVGAKRLYFGVGGSLDDFVDLVRARGATVEQVREESEGVRRGVVRVWL